MGIINILKPRSDGGGSGVTGIRNIGELVCLGNPMENPEPTFLECYNEYSFTAEGITYALASDYSKLSEVYPIGLHTVDKEDSVDIISYNTDVNNPPTYLKFYGFLPSYFYYTLYGDTFRSSIGSPTVVYSGTKDKKICPFYCNNRWYFLSNSSGRVSTVEISSTDFINDSSSVIGITISTDSVAFSITYHPELKKYFAINNLPKYGIIGQTITLGYKTIHTSIDGINFTETTISYTTEGELTLASITYVKDRLYITARLITPDNTNHLLVLDSIDNINWNETFRIPIESGDIIPYGLSNRGNYIYPNSPCTNLTFNAQYIGFIYEIGVGLKYSEDWITRYPKYEGRGVGEVVSMNLYNNKFVISEKGSYERVRLYDIELNRIPTADLASENLGYSFITNTSGNEILGIEQIASSDYNDSIFDFYVKIPPGFLFFYRSASNVAPPQFDRRFYIYTGEEE